MKIEINERGSKEFYKEVVSVMAQYFRFMKKPDSRLNDPFRILKIYIAVCAAFFAVILVMGIAWGFDALTLVALTVMAAVIILSVMQFKKLDGLVKSFYDDKRSSILTVDENGVELNKEDSEIIRMAWDNVAFLRLFKESACFFGKEARGMIMAVDRIYEQQILDYLKDNDIDVKVIGR